MDRSLRGIQKRGQNKNKESVSEIKTTLNLLVGWCFFSPVTTLKAFLCWWLGTLAALWGHRRPVWSGGPLINNLKHHLAATSGFSPRCPAPKCLFGPLPCPASTAWLLGTSASLVPSPLPWWSIAMLGYVASGGHPLSKSRRQVVLMGWWGVVSAKTWRC